MAGGIVMLLFINRPRIDTGFLLNLTKAIA